MNSRTVLILGAAVAALIAAIFFINNEPSAPTSAPALPAKSENSTTNVGPSTSSATVSSDGDASPDSSSFSEATEDRPDGQTFHVDVAGNLMLDEQTRLNIEALVAQTESREWDEALREQTEQLPPGAAKLAEELIAKFASYQQAQRQDYPPDDAPVTLEDAERQLEGLHALREAHFGPEVARKFYGNEEIIAREMIEVMRVENDHGLTSEEKTERARALRERLPGLSAIEKNNRSSDAAQPRN